MTDTAISMQGLRVNAGGRDILTLDNFTVPMGSFAALLGANGSGKTTLLRSCCGFVGIAAGNVKMLGEDVGSLSWRALAHLRRRVGYVQQLLPDSCEIPLTVREIVAIGRSGIAGFFKRLSRDDYEIVDHWIETLGISEIAARGYGEISGGQQRKVLIARAMVQQPEILLLDEPTANLDITWRERIVELMEQLYAGGLRTVVLVCHELEVIPPCCTQVSILDGGRLIATGSADDVLTDEAVAQLYGDKLQLLRRGGRMILTPAARSGQDS